MIYTSPKKSAFTGELTIDPSKAVVYCASCGDTVMRACGQFGLSFSERNAGVIISVAFSDTRDLTYIDESRRITDEKFILRTYAEGNVLNADILCSGEKSLFYALCKLFGSIKDGSVPLGEVADYPLFAKRGFIEGFYGKPWTADERISSVRLLSAHGMNTFFYAPKDDPYHRDLWREDYPAQQLESLRNLFYETQSRYMDFVFCISPGLSMKYSSDADFCAMTHKLRGIYDIGVRSFGLLLDDIPDKLQYAEDIAAYADVAQAHVSIVNRLYDTVKSWSPEVSLTVCPLEYHGRGDEYYISKLGRGIDADVSIFWTGHNICSQELTVPEAFTFIQSTRHKPLYWDNFPVNDAEMYNEMHMGYIAGREAELYRYSEGIISNCMEFAECSKVPLLTVADYLWNPVDYDPQESWRRALDEVVGEGSVDFAVFAENLLVSCLKVQNCPEFCDMILTANYEIKYGEPFKAMGLLSDYIERLDRCCDLLESRKDEKLLVELAPWIEKFMLYRELLKLCADLIFSNDEDLKPVIAEKLRIYKNMPVVISEFAFQMTIEQFVGETEL